MALVAEAIALIALALDDPPEPFAYAVLAGTAALLIALGSPSRTSSRTRCA
jgi:multidrug transporter EmrE-like cation transporter